MDLVIRLRELRARAGLTQEQTAERSGIGPKTISSFESGSRIGGMKVSQLERLLAVYGVTIAYFFSEGLAAELRGHRAPMPSGPEPFRLEDLPEPIRVSLATWAARLTGSVTPPAPTASHALLRVVR